jgi:hypothetical protein
MRANSNDQALIALLRFVSYDLEGLHKAVIIA